MEIRELLRAAPNKSEWVSWLCTSKAAAAQHTLRVLSISFSHIPPDKRRTIGHDRLKGDHNEIHSLIYELVAFETLRRLGLAPTWSPRIGGMNPDLKFSCSDGQFISDVCMVHSPKKAVEELGDGFIESVDDMSDPARSRANKISEKVRSKANKYSKLDTPLVLFVFFADHHLLDPMKVEKALFGMTLEEVGVQPRYPFDLNHGFPYPGILRDDRGGAQYTTLSAVVACDWFDTLNRNDPGKRLHCIVYHHWAPASQLPENAFSRFCQVLWSNRDCHEWIPNYSAQPNTVARFVGEDDIIYAPYSPTNPW